MVAARRYDLIDAEELNRQYPESFSVPPTAIRMALPDNCYVKLGFKTGQSKGIISERIWVKLVSKEASEDLYYGTIHNDPAFVDLKFGDQVCFSSKHICDVDTNP